MLSCWYLGASGSKPRRRGPLNIFDLVILAIIAGAVFGGYRAGFVTRAISWVGLGAGVGLAILVAPLIVDSLRQTGDPQLRALVTVGIFVTVASLGATLGEVAGVSLRRLIPPGPARQVDKAVGAVAGGLSVVVLLWLLLPALGEVPGEISGQVRNSVVARAVDDYAPRAPGPLQALRDLVQDANFPRVFEGLQPSPGTGPPPEASGLTEEVAALVTASTVRVSGEACGHVLEGSGFSPEADVVVTNAHVVAGVEQLSVQRPDGRRLRARVVVFDPNRDLAVLEVAGLDEAPLAMGGADVGESGAVFGHPGGQVEIEISPARIERRVNALGRNLYDTQTIRRDILILASELAPGDSGGALVDTDGTVVGVAFAIAPDEPGTAYALSSDELQSVLEMARSGPVDTGPCIR
ncbi:MAG: MarP family serine protease [Acidimicrobiales bacterium]